MICITGDTHGQIDYNHLSSAAFPAGKDLTKNDYVIVPGDFGVLWANEPTETEKYLIDWYNNKPWTTLFIDGNHENFYRIKRLEQVPMFGSVVGKVSDSIYHLHRGEIYNIDDINVFTFGGAESIDRASRIEGASWWREERPSGEELRHGLEMLQTRNNIVDIVISHECPQQIFDKLQERGIVGNEKSDFGRSLRTYFDVIKETVSFKSWFFGHYHVDAQLDNFYAMYKATIKLERM